MNDPQTAARKAAAIKVFENVVAAEKAGARSEAVAQLTALGVRLMDILMPDGTAVGTLSISGGKETAKVVDERAFLAWVKKNAPGEVVETVRDSYRKALLKQIQGSGELPDGVELGQGDPYSTVRLSKGAEAIVLAAMRSGQIEPLALPGGES